MKVKIRHNYRKRKKIERLKHKRTEKAYSCDICSKVFAKKGFLSQHLKSLTKPFTCDKCGETLSTKQSLEKHKETHSDIISYLCDFSNKVFSGITHLANHKRVAHGEKMNLVIFVGSYSLIRLGLQYTQGFIPKKGHLRGKYVEKHFLRNLI